MNQKEWAAVERARKILKLGDRATLGEIKRSYHALSKRYHPDNQEKGSSPADPEAMYQLTAAYDCLMKYCAEYRFPLVRQKANPADVHDPEQWWMDRFGEQAMWTRGKK